MSAGPGWDAVALLVDYPRAGSPLARELDPRRTWTPEAYLLAALLDTLRALAYGLGGGKGKRPRPVPRPKAPKEQKPARGLSAEAFNKKLKGG